MPQHHPDSTPTYYAPQMLNGFAADTAAQPLPAPSSPHLTAVQTVAPQPATPRPEAPLHNNTAMTLLLAAILTLLMCYRSGYKYIKRLSHNLFSVRRRENMFDDNTATESKILAALTATLCVSQALLLFEGLPHFVPTLAAPMSHHVGLHVAALALLALTFFLIQLAIYHLLCYVFADKVETRLWLGGFKASHALLAICLIPVVGTMLAVPRAATVMLPLAAALYIGARILFICKGFRIFRGKIASYVRFFLYLCTLELVPPAIALVAAVAISANI